MKTPSNKPLSLYPTRKPDTPVTGRIDTGRPAPLAEHAREEQREKLAEIDERFKHLDQNIETAQHKGDDATVSHGILGVGGTAIKKASS